MPPWWWSPWMVRSPSAICARNPARLSAPEALSLLASGLAVLSSGQAPGALRSAVDKLVGVVVPEGDLGLVVDLREPELVGRMRAAAAEGEALQMTYTALSSGETTERIIEPWSVFSTLGNWYVRAFCRLKEGERVFRVDRIRDVASSGDRFAPPDVVPPPVVQYTPGEEDVFAIIRLKAGARWVADYYPVETISDEGEEVVVRFSANDPAVVGRLLLRLGDEAVLIEGEEVATSLADLRRRILHRYATST